MRESTFGYVGRGTAETATTLNVLVVIALNWLSARLLRGKADSEEDLVRYAAATALTAVGSQGWKAVMSGARFRLLRLSLGSLARKTWQLLIRGRALGLPAIRNRVSDVVFRVGVRSGVAGMRSGNAWCSWSWRVGA